MKGQDKKTIKPMAKKEAKSYFEQKRLKKRLKTTLIKCVPILNFQSLGEKLVNKDRSLICSRCHRTVKSSEYAKHLQTHKGKYQMVKQPKINLTNQSGHIQTSESGIKPVRTYPCGCGSEFENRNSLWNHVKTCRDIADSRQTCLICSEPEEVFLSTENIDRICPSCALDHFKSKIILGVPVINHMGLEYENAFREKAGSLLKYLSIGTLKELGITMVLITFSADGSTAYCISPKGEVVFVLNNTEDLREMNYESFESVISHEIFHAYITNNLKLGIGSKLHHPFTFVGGHAAQVAEDIELIKIAIERNVEPLC